MTELNHFAISAALGSTLGPTVKLQHGQLGSLQLAATMGVLKSQRSEYIEDLSKDATVDEQFEKGVKRAFLQVRDGYSSDRVLADPVLDRKFIQACRNFGIEGSVFQLNKTLLGLRKHNKLKDAPPSRRADVPDQWRYSVASEIAARVMFYRHGATVDTLLCHPRLVEEFDALAATITPNQTPFEYRWAALHMRKKGASERVRREKLAELHWSRKIHFDDARQAPQEKGIYALNEADSCLFVAATQNIQESISSQRRIAHVTLFEKKIWKPDPQRLFWRFVRMSNTGIVERYGYIYTLVSEWRPIFNIPRGDSKLAA